MKKMLANFKNEILSKEDLKSIKGGSSYSCQCNGTGTWTGNYDSVDEVVTAINNYCSGGGTCNIQ